MSTELSGRGSNATKSAIFAHADRILIAVSSLKISQISNN